MKQPFAHPDYLLELKHDGFRDEAIIYFVCKETGTRYSMDSGLINLSCIYAFVRQHRSDRMRAMKIDGTSDLGNAYSKLCLRVVSDVPRQQGLYLWGFYNRNGFWTNIYLGKAGFGKTANLHARLFKELTAERACIWREVADYKYLDKVGRQIHPAMWDKQYVHHWRRACEKSGATHIVWIALPQLDKKSIVPIENDLIESMNPTGNRRRTKPPEQFRKDTKHIFGEFREVINLKANRDQRFTLELHKDWPIADWC